MIGARRTTRGAFTLIEILVAVGAFAIVAVAISSIFGSVGDTISAGRRQSRLNSYAAQIERIMRADFEKMTRDGFLVIRHEYAIREEGNDVDADNDALPDRLDVPAFPGDTNPRPRRVDQIMFFARGSFTSARGEVQPGFTAESNEARIWYGQGQSEPKAADIDATHEWYSEPRLDDDMQGRVTGARATLPNIAGGKAAWDRLGFDPGVVGAVNPNRYAQNWTLLRHVTLLVPVNDAGGQALPDFGSDGLYGETVNRASTGPERTWVTDTAFQVALQPAVSGIFWSAQNIDPSKSTSVTNDGYVSGFDPNISPNTPTGRRAVVRAYDADGLGEVAQARTASGLVDVATTDLREIESVVTGVDHLVRNPGQPIFDLSSFEEWARNKGFPNSTAKGIKPWQWMVDALPGAPLEGFYGDWTTGSDGLGLKPGDRTTARVRYEPTPPDLNAGANEADKLKGAYEQADQEVLTRWAFVPRCTEFIVEWSYGWVYGPSSEFPLNAHSPYDVAKTDPRYRQIVWFGHERRTMDTDGDGDIDADDAPTVLEYSPRTQSMSASENTGDPLRNLLTGQGAAQHAVFTPPTEPETYAFGYFEPQAQPFPGVTRFRPWPWPTLVRVTMTVADPGDPSIETTVQAVFEVPDPER